MATNCDRSASTGAYQAMRPMAPMTTRLVSTTLRQTLMSASRTLSASRVVRGQPISPMPWRKW